MVHNAWEISPLLAIRMGFRFTQPVIQAELQRHISSHPHDVLDIPEALVLLLGERLVRNTTLDLKVSFLMNMDCCSCFSIELIYLYIVHYSASNIGLVFRQLRLRVTSPLPMETTLYYYNTR